MSGKMSDDEARTAGLPVDGDSPDSDRRDDIGSRAMLQALRAAMPDARPSLTLTDDGASIMIGICDSAETENPRFHLASLDPSDYSRSPKDLAAEIAAWHRAAKGAS